MIDDAILLQAASVLTTCRAAGTRIATAESCTGGLIAATLTSIAGSSDVFDRGFVTYSNEAKTEMVGVLAELIERHGAVSEPVAEAMAMGTMAHSLASIAVAVTGVAGPGGGSPEKPVGLVCFGLAVIGQPPVTYRKVFPGDRTEVRRATVGQALALVHEAASALLRDHEEKAGA